MNLEVGESLCHLIDIIHPNFRFQRNNVSKPDHFIWSTLTAQCTTPPLPPMSFSLSLKLGVFPGQPVGNTRMRAPNGFVARDNQAVPCLNGPSLSHPMIRLEPGQPLVEIIESDSPFGYFEENGRRMSSWMNPPAPLTFALDEERWVIDEVHSYDPSRSTASCRGRCFNLL